MKFIIARSTVEATVGAINEIREISEMSAIALPSGAEINAKDNKANVGIRAVDDNIIVEIHDDVLLKYLTLYVKTTRLVAPVVKAAVSMFSAVQHVVKSDIQDWIDFVNQPKAK